MKRKTCFLWKNAMLSALAVLTLGISAGAVEYSGTCGAEGSNAAWKLDTETGLMTISGQGALAEYGESLPTPWEAYKKQITSLVVEEGITDIGRSFYDHNRLVSVDLPETLGALDADAFAYCSDLKSIDIPDGVLSIGENAFIDCWDLVSVKLPKNLTKIGKYAFFGCDLLEGEIVIPAGVTNIDRAAFAWCRNLEAITVAEGNTAFCDVGGVLYTADMATLLAYPAGKTDTEYTLPAGVTTIGEYAASKAAALEEITLPKSLTAIEKMAFLECSALQSVEIPENVDSIGQSAFWGCANLKMACFRGDAPSETGKNIFVRSHSDFRIYCCYGKNGWLDGDRYNEEESTWEGSPLGIWMEDYGGYAREAIAAMENGEKLTAIYDRIALGVRAMKEDISLEGIEQAARADVKLAMEAYVADHPKMYWLAGSFGYTIEVGGGISEVNPKYTMDEDEAAQAAEEIDAAAGKILAGISDSMSEFEKELLIHDRLVEHITYGDSANAHNLYGALVEGVAVCEGYAEAFQYLLSCVGIQSHVAVGSGYGQAHGWNLVRIDGAYYYVDVTWDDADEELFHNYFNVTTAQIQEDHVFSGNVLPLPECTATAANYYSVYPGKLSVLDVKSVAALFKREGSSYTARIYGAMEDPGQIWTWFTQNAGAVAQELGLEGSFSCTASASGREYHLMFLPAGQGGTLTGQVTGYDGGKEVTVQLLANGQMAYETKIAAAGGSGEVTRTFAFADVAAGSYDLVVSKAGHLDYTIRNITFSGGDLDLTKSGKAYANIHLCAGDVNGDGAINSGDLNTVWSVDNYFKSVGAPGVNSAADINGDGTINSDDLNIIWKAENYMKIKADCSFDY